MEDGKHHKKFNIKYMSFYVLKFNLLSYCKVYTCVDTPVTRLVLYLEWVVGSFKGVPGKWVIDVGVVVVNDYETED